MPSPGVRLAVQVGAPSIAAQWVARLCTVQPVALPIGHRGALPAIDRRLLMAAVSGLLRLLLRGHIILVLRWRPALLSAQLPHRATHRRHTTRRQSWSLRHPAATTPTQTATDTRLLGPAPLAPPNFAGLAAVSGEARQKSRRAKHRGQHATQTARSNVPFPDSAQRLQQENASNKAPPARTEPQNQTMGAT